MSILLVQHDSAEGVALVNVLELAGFTITAALDGEEAGSIDAVAFDVVAIGSKRAVSERVALCQRLRREGYLGAIVTVGVSPRDVAPLLDAGADDFVLAPVQPAELVARVRMALGRVVTRARYRWGPLEIDRVHRTTLLRGSPLSLTAREYGLLASLMEAGGEVVSRADLLSKIWARDEDPVSNLVEVHLSRLRDKLGTDASLIETVRGAGYRLRRPAGQPRHGG